MTFSLSRKQTKGNNKRKGSVVVGSPRSRGPTGERERDPARLSTGLWSRQAVGRCDSAQTAAEPSVDLGGVSSGKRRNGARGGGKAAHSSGPRPKRDVSSSPGRTRPCHATGRRALLVGRRVGPASGTGPQQPKMFLEASRNLAPPTCGARREPRGEPIALFLPGTTTPPAPWPQL